MYDKRMRYRVVPNLPQNSDGQEPHGQDSPGHYIHIRFVF